MPRLPRVNPIELAAYEAPRIALVTAMESVCGQQAASTAAEVSASTSADILAALATPAVTTIAPPTAAVPEKPRAIAFLEKKIATDYYFVRVYYV